MTANPSDKSGSALNEAKGEKPKLTPSEEFEMLNEDLIKTLRVLIYKQLQFRLTHDMTDIENSLSEYLSTEADMDYLKQITCYK
jgi:hypothetical protein